MKRYSVTLIGMGPRGLSVFERLAAHARASLCPIDLILIEPGPCGPGVHAARQPQHLVMDTPAGQVTVFPVAGTLDPAPACVTPTLAEWARAQGLRRYGAEVHRAGEGGAAIGDDDYLPRQLLGRYLAWAYGAIAASLPPTVRLEHLRHRAVDMVRQPDGGFVVELDSGFCVASDFVFLATGPSCRQLTDEEAQLRKFAQDHSRCNSRLRYLRHVYPLEQLGAISQQAEVAIGGMGAVAHDVLAELTVGRGGRFEQVGEQLRYVASSQEPRMTLFSRTGLAPCARACATPAPVTFHFFTAEALRDLRARARRERGDSQLDFERQLLPLLLQDMAYAFRCNQDGQAPDPVWYRPGVEERRAIDALLFPLRGKAFAGAPEGAGEFSAFAERLLRDDIAQAQQAAATGILSPLQAAASLLRAAAPLLRECVEHGGLQSASHRAFLDVFGPALARAGAGLPLARLQQLAALIDAGVVRLADGPDPAVQVDEERSRFALHGAEVQHADVLVVAHLDGFSPQRDDTLLMRNLLKRGTVRPYCNGGFHPGGLDVDPGHHPLDRLGRPATNVWALGWLTEGPHYQNTMLPAPQAQAPEIMQAERCVAALFTELDARTRPRASRAGARERNALRAVMAQS